MPPEFTRRQALQLFGLGGLATISFGLSTAALVAHTRESGQSRENPLQVDFRDLFTDLKRFDGMHVATAGKMQSLGVGIGDSLGNYRYPTPDGFTYILFDTSAENDEIFLGLADSLLAVYPQSTPYPGYAHSIASNAQIDAPEIDRKFEVVGLVRPTIPQDVPPEGLAPSRKYYIEIENLRAEGN